VKDLGEPPGPLDDHYQAGQLAHLAAHRLPIGLLVGGAGKVPVGVQAIGGDEDSARAEAQPAEVDGDAGWPIMPPATRW
jgi:hypothetical protein